MDSMRLTNLTYCFIWRDGQSIKKSHLESCPSADAKELMRMQLSSLQVFAPTENIEKQLVEQ